MLFQERGCFPVRIVFIRVGVSQVKRITFLSINDEHPTIPLDPRAVALSFLFSEKCVQQADNCSKIKTLLGKMFFYCGIIA
jgi:hypothetical protein